MIYSTVHTYSPAIWIIGLNRCLYGGLKKFTAGLRSRQDFMLLKVWIPKQLANIWAETDLSYWLCVSEGQCHCLMHPWWYSFIHWTMSSSGYQRRLFQNTEQVWSQIPLDFLNVFSRFLSVCICQLNHFVLKLSGRSWSPMHPLIMVTETFVGLNRLSSMMTNTIN